jgi:hypothetical protein
MGYTVEKIGSMGGRTRNRQRITFDGDVSFIADKADGVWIAQHVRGGRLVVDDAPTWLKLVAALTEIAAQCGH